MFFCYVDSGIAARAKATVQATKTKRESAWRCWCTFLDRVGMHQFKFLEGLSRFQRNIIFCAFAQAVREAELSPQEMEQNWWREQLYPPSCMWLGPSGQAIDVTPDWTKTVRPASSCANNHGDMTMQMLQ